LHDVVLEIFIGDLVLGALHPAAHGDAGLVHGIGIAGDQRVPPIEVASVRDELVAAARRQPVQGADVFRGQPDAVGNLGGAVRVVLAGAGARIEQLAGDMGEIDLPVLVLELSGGARAVAQALPFGADICSNVLVFQKKPSCPEGGLGGAVMIPVEPGLNPSWGAGDGRASGRAPSYTRFAAALGLLLEITSRAIGLSLVSRPRSDRTAAESPSVAKAPWACRNIQARRSQVPFGHLERF
jgi:hypothetical protein